jgi:hypothetical protein
MFNFFKKKKSWVRFYSLDQSIATVYPVTENRLVDRDWNGLGDTSRNLDHQGKQTVLNCPAIKQITNIGYVLRAPADFVIKTTGNGVDLYWQSPIFFKRPSNKYSFNSDEGYYISQHTPPQTEPVIPTDLPNTNRPTLHSAVKVETPWRVKTSDDIVFLQIPVSYNNEARFTAATGIVDPKYMHAVSVQLFWHVMEGETLIKAGTPLVQYVPISRELVAKGNTEFIVDVADEVDLEIEEAYVFANHSRFPKFDTVGKKIRVITDLFNFYRNKYPKSKI